jgi:thioredoxin
MTVKKADPPQSFQDLITTADQPVLVDFWAAWCGPCRIVAPVMEKIAREYKGRLVTVKVNVDEKPQVAGQYQVQSVPTIMLFWKGQPVMRTMGTRSYEEMKTQIDLNWPYK